MQLNGDRLRKKTIPDDWIMCQVVECKALDGGDYRIELRPIDGQSSGPVTSFTLHLGEGDDGLAVTEISYISRIMHGKNIAEIADDSHTPVVEHFQYSGEL
ncbi:hypothetical protein EGH24_04305 [Halonotius terrestris]|uniref:Uncharacterized protein n=1 Tax=Halonotius terrestris TaxID=2487750 RepID=A0A8J8PCI0_9EURY|nr:hypothetical protein [Halonotius terrestris]TQQ82677.1 hypothetical protein EGH24_04305 [Halonotius terrestris]